MSNNEKDFAPYEEALALKDLGFDEPCNTCYDKLEMVASYGASVFDYKNYNTTGYMVSRPTFSQAFRWFNENYDLFGVVEGKGYDHKRYYIYSINGKWHPSQPSFDKPEEAELACLKKLIGIANEQQ